MTASMYVGVPCERLCSQKRAWDPVELELGIVVSHSGTLEGPLQEQQVLITAAPR